MNWGSLRWDPVVGCGFLSCGLFVLRFVSSGLVWVSLFCMVSDGRVVCLDQMAICR